MLSGADENFGHVSVDLRLDVNGASRLDLGDGSDITRTGWTCTGAIRIMTGGNPPAPGPALSPLPQARGSKATETTMTAAKVGNLMNRSLLKE